jgi:AcrR family transcriptional regulator
MERRFIHATTAPRSINLMRVMMRAGMHDSCGDPGEGGRVQLRALFREVARQFERYLERQAQLGRIRPVNAGLAAQFLYAALISLSVRKMMGSEELTGMSLDEIAQSITDIFLHGVLPQAEQARHEEQHHSSAVEVNPPL